MMNLSAIPIFITLLVSFACGLILGFIYFSALRETTDLIVKGSQPLLAFSLTLGRFALLGVGFYVIVLTGGLSLLAALLGVLCAKILMLRQTGSANT